MGSCSTKSQRAITPTTIMPIIKEDAKLQEPQRRRLSVSAVEGDQHLTGILASKSKEFAEAVATMHRQSSTEQKKSGKSSSSSSSSLSEAAAESEEPAKRVDAAPPKKRAPIRKVEDAGSTLSYRSGPVTDVTLSMIADLVSASQHSYLVFGDPADCQQRGFDHKKLATAGTLTSSRVDLQQWGIGYACKKGFKPESPNQDDFFVCMVDDWCLLGVFDGHGPFGHDISSFVHRTLPYLLLCDPEWENDPLGVMKRCFVTVHALLEAHAMNGTLDCSLSGTTGTVVLFRDNTVYCAWVGDSRAVMVSGSADNPTVEDLSRDHKPTLPSERKRIESSGGEVRKLEGDIPHRVFIKGRLYPGLAMSRAMGDSVGAVVGVTAEPETVEKKPPEGQDSYLIIASDGVWEFIDSQEAGKIISSRIQTEGIQKATSYLAYDAWRRWVQEEESVVDDVTCVVLKI